LLLDRPNQPEVTDLGIALFVDENIGWFEVSVDEPRLMDIVDGFGYLVKDKLAVFIGENVLGPAHLVQICVHVLEEQVDILPIFGFEDFLQCDDVGVFEL
jgi:hypothetical protein